ncbi:DNA repair protein RAD51-like protein 2 [Bienertia sinuspersici]
MAMVESIMVELLIFPCDILFRLDDFKSWNTISDVKSEACKKASELGLQICPAGGDVMSGEMLYGAGSPILLDNSTTLGSLCDNLSRYQISNCFYFHVWM